jgi:hypothetical protein
MGEDRAAPARPAWTGKGLARSRGLAILAGIAAAGAALWSPGRPGEDAPPPETTEGPLSGALILACAGPGEDPAEGALIASRVRAAFDPRRSLLRLDDGRERIVPRGARSVLVDSAGRVQAFREPLLSPALIRALCSLPPAALAARLRDWANGTQPLPHGTAADERLRRFLLDR